MSFNFNNANEEKLNKNVENLITWASTQPHLPKINELQAILFLHCCYNDEEAAKKVIDSFFTIKTAHPALFKNRNPLKPPLKESLDVILVTPLPKKTPEGYTILFLKIIDTNPSRFNSVANLKICDMVAMLHLHQDELSEGHVMVVDFKGAVFGHLLRASPSALKNFLHYVQEGIPGRPKMIHFVNIVPFIDEIMGLIKPFIKKRLADMFRLHQTVEELSKFIPLELLPEDYGGSIESTSILHEKIKKKVFENMKFFEWEDQQCVDESKRPGKEKS